MKSILNDQFKFKSVKNDNNLDRLIKFQRFLARLKTKGALSLEDYQRIWPTSAATLTLYGLPKLHRERVPLRPILSSIGSYNHECATWLSEILTPLRHHKATVKDLFEFLQRISNMTSDGKIMASPDVKSLFTNISVNFTIDLILNKMFSNNITHFHGLTKPQLKKLLHCASKGTVFQFYGHLYEQIDSVAMRSPIAPLFADICMNWVWDQIPSNNKNPDVIVKYVDNLFCTFSHKNHLINYFQCISNIHPNIHFSKELEINNQLPYLDILVSKVNNKFETMIFRKNTNTGLYTKWNSLCPFKYKRNLVQCLLSRAYKICTSWQNIHNEFESITSMLLKNGYPLAFIQNQIRT